MVSSYEGRIKKLLRKDRRFFERISPVVTWLANALVVVWLCLTVVALLKTGADEARLMLLVGVIPVALFWLLSRAGRSMLAWARENYPP